MTLNFFTCVQCTEPSDTYNIYSQYRAKEAKIKGLENYWNILIHKQA
jgi:hypothetical protein